MKSNAVVCAVITLALAGMASMAAQQYVEPPTPIETETKAIEDHTLGEGLARGCANIVLGWIELPKNITYYSVEWPVVGLIPGVLEGAGMTGIRVAGGLNFVPDVVCGLGGLRRDEQSRAEQQAQPQQ